MPINPKRILTQLGINALLNSGATDGGSGPLALTSAHLLTAVTVDPGDRVVSAYTKAVEGMGAAVPLGTFSDPVTSDSGNTYVASELLEWTAAGVTGSQAVIGVMVSLTSTIGDIQAFLEFDEPVVVDENGETIEMKIEFGYGVSGLYLVPRLIALGS